MLMTLYFHNHQVSDNAPNSQFAENDGFDYPVQPRSTYTNLGYAVTAGIALGLFERKFIKFTLPYLLVAFWAECVAISSALFHASAGYGDTGKLDVACILPFVVTVLWHEVWTLVLMYNSYRCRLTQRNSYHNFVDCRYPPFGSCWWVTNIIIFCLTFILFSLEFFQVVNLPWDTELNIFVGSILTLVFLGIVIVMWSVIKGYIRRRHITLSVQNHLIGIFFTVLLIVIFITWSYYSSQWAHGLRVHMAASTAVSLILVYSKSVFNEVYNV